MLPETETRECVFRRGRGREGLRADKVVFALVLTSPNLVSRRGWTVLTEGAERQVARRC